MFFNNTQPIELSNEEAPTLSSGPILEMWPLIKSSAIQTYCIRTSWSILKFENIFGESVDFIAKFKGASLIKEDLINFIELIKENDVSLITPTFKIL